MSRIRWLAEFASTSVLACSVSAVVGTGFFGSWSEFLAAASGRSVAATVQRCDRGIAPEGAMVALVSLQNLLPREVRLLGSHATCGCTMTTELPDRLKPFERRLVAVVISPNAPGGQVGVRFITDVMSEQPEVQLAIAD